MKIYNLRLVCLTFFLIITACKDSDKDEQPLLEPINFVSHNDIPEVMSTFYEKFNLGPGAIQKGSIETDNKYDIDVEAILEVVDSLENKNYTFRVDDKDNDVFTFTNLVIKKRESGVIDEPYFLEYIVDEEAKQEFVRSNFSIAAFRGIFTKRYVNGTYANSNYKAQANLDQKSLSDPEVGSDLGPCDQVYDYMSDGGNLSGDGNGGIITGDYSGFTGGGVRTLVCFDVLEPITTTSECEVIKSDFGDFPAGPGCHRVINADGKGWHFEGSTTTTTWLRKKRCWYVYETTVESTSSCPDEESEDIGILGPVSSEYLIAKPEFNSVEEYANYLGFAASHFSQFPDMQEAALSLADALAIPYTLDEIRELAERSWRVVTTFNKYSGFGYSIDQISQSDQLQIASDLAYINFFPEIKTRISESDWPLTTQEWEALWGIFKPLMGELLLEAVPGGGITLAFRDIIEGADNADAVVVTAGLVSLMVEFFPPGKVAKSVFRVGKVVRKGFKFVKYGRKYLNSIGSALESGLKADVDGALIKFSKNGDEVAQISGGTMIVSKHGIPTKDGSVVFKQADDVNSNYPTGWEPPYAYNSPVTEFITSQNEQFVRVFSEGVTDQQGRWIMKKSDIEGLSASQIKDRFAIPMDGLPNRIVDVSIPSGIKLRTGKAASTSGGNGGGIQFEIPHPDPFASNWFTNIRILP